MKGNYHWLVYCMVICLLLDEFSVCAEPKRGGGRGGGWFPSMGSGRKVDTGGRYPGQGRNGGFGSLPGTGTLGRRVGTGGGGLGVGRSALTGALAGLAAGYVGAKVGRALAGGWYHGRYYHFGDRYYSGPGPHRIRCTIVTPDDFSMHYDDGRRVREVIYECDRYREMCCVEGCCPRRY